MRILGIIQPGRLGDIIICLPIAKWYADRGYKVVWPIHDVYLSNFINNIDYVDFFGLSALSCNEARNFCISKCNNIIDLSITMDASHPVNDTFFQLSRNQIPFDRLKYLFADVPFEQKWNLSFNRNILAEQSLQNFLDYDGRPFTLVHTNGSSESFTYNHDGDEYVIYVDQYSSSIFDWYGMIAKASKIVAIDSSFANLVNQVNSSCLKILVRRKEDIRPVYLNWIVI